MSYKKDPPRLKKAEETWGDLDGDHERGESPVHQQKVRKATKAMAKKGGNLPPAFLKGAGTGKVAPSGPEIPSGGLKKSSGSAGKMCPACTKSKKSSCSHM